MLPQEIVDTIFSWIDVSFIYDDSYYINYDISQIFKNTYFTTSCIGRSTKQLFLEKKKLFKKYAVQFMIYKNISLTSIPYSNYDRYYDTFDSADINLMLILFQLQLNNGL